ncbi:MAG: hypothetical protein R3C42_01730 [Parvularculaceae bacterium]
MIRETAPAKINLFLHVGALRADRLHDLESLFVFADAGDMLEASASDDLTLEISGQFAGALRAEPIETISSCAPHGSFKGKPGSGAAPPLRSTSVFPSRPGIGGGSADAAAALRALVRLWRVDISPDDLRALAFRLGADVPACLSRAPVWVGGAGETVTAGPLLPPLWVCSPIRGRHADRADLPRFRRRQSSAGPPGTTADRGGRVSQRSIVVGKFPE